MSKEMTYDEPTEWASATESYDAPYSAPLVVQQPSSAGSGDMAVLFHAAASRPPRDPRRMTEIARTIGAKLALQLDNLGNNRALYSWEQGKGRVEGPTVGLVEALASEWGYIATKIEITSIEGDRVTIQCSIFDLQSVTMYVRPSVFTLAPASGRYAAKADQMQRWETMQVQSALSKAVRVALQHALPAWYVGAAVAAAKAEIGTKVLKDEPVKVAAQPAIEALGSLGVTQPQVERWVGGPAATWTATDVANLRALFKRIRDNETTVAAEFPPVPASGIAAVLGEKQA